MHRNNDLARFAMRAVRRKMHPPEVRSAILERIAEGESLRKAATHFSVAPSTVLLWVNTDTAFAEQYAAARARGYQLLADEIIDISDEEDYEPVPGAREEDAAKEVRFDATAVARNRLRVDSRKWMLSKMLPKLYGDKLDLNHSGSVSVFANSLDEAI